MFLEKRVYQGSSGKVYPLPFTDRISEKPIQRKWKAIWIENEFLRVLVLPEIGGRIHALEDKISGYDLIYRQHVIKPALVGLAGPWISGGIEFNWPQHHRPATFLPVDFEIEEHADGSKTIWCSDHDPMTRMKGMHGVCLHPGKAYLELKVRAYNRTPFMQTFLWWANVATRVHEAYQSFFPPDVYYVADHARRSMSEYPLALGRYYGVNYGERGRKGIPKTEIPAQFVPPHACAPKVSNGITQIPDYEANDLSWYANIPVPTSYMCMGSKQDFFGGYDHRVQAGIVHVADHHIAPGKKQWTWGNHEFGYAWDRNLTDKDAHGEFGPYIELMAGVFTDNQPDFSFLQPGETKSWSQYWYPIHQIGAVQHANLDASVALRLVAGSRKGANVRVGICVTARFARARISVQAGRKRLVDVERDLAPGAPFLFERKLPAGMKEGDLTVLITRADGVEIILFRPQRRVKGRVPPPASEPVAPEKMSSVEDLYLTGVHLEQYRHATRCPTLYWHEALRRDPLDSRCNNAMGRWHLRRGEFAEAERHFRSAIERATRRNANPEEGEPFYNLGLCLRYANSESESSNLKFQDAYAAFYKATWNQAWAAAAYHALAEMDCSRRDWKSALEHVRQSLRLNSENLRARNLNVIVLRKLQAVGNLAEAAELAEKTNALDPLDWHARYLNGESVCCDWQTRLDIAHDLARAGLWREAIDWLKEGPQRNGEGDVHDSALARKGLPDQNWGAAPLVQYTLGWMHLKLGDNKSAKAHFRAGAALPADYCFPARLEEIEILETAMRTDPADARAAYYLGNLLYDRRRHDEAIELWERSARLDPKISVVSRNLGIGYFNIRKQPARARAAYDRAFRVNPADARVFFERDQLWKRLGVAPAKRLREMERRSDLVRKRDDLSVELCSLYNQTAQHEKACALMASRHFQPWEGGEGGPLGQHVRSHLALGRKALAAERVPEACAHFREALSAPRNLGEAKHLLANQSDIHYWLGCALAKAGDRREARKHWLAAATFTGDFQEMSVRAFSEMTYYSALAWERLGLRARARKLFKQLLDHARRLRRTRARVDYFATSLPTMLLFDDDLQFRQETASMFLEAQACLGLGQTGKARTLLRAVLRRDPNHPLAADL
jgi:tetratricopeptide (TPR) repeat protein